MAQQIHNLEKELQRIRNQRQEIQTEMKALQLATSKLQAMDEELEEREQVVDQLQLIQFGIENEKWLPCVFQFILIKWGTNQFRIALKKAECKVRNGNGGEDYFYRCDLYRKKMGSDTTFQLDFTDINVSLKKYIDELSAPTSFVMNQGTIIELKYSYDPIVNYFGW